MSSLKISVNNLTIRFRQSYDKTWTLRDKLHEIVKRIAFRYEPEYFSPLRQLSLDIHEGDILGIIGPNGCGKTTLLRAISGIYYPDEGTVESNGKISTLLSLGTGFDNRLNGIDNIRLNGLISGMTMSEIERHIPDIIEFADIGDHIYKPMKYYSSGMISRVSFAIALSMQPDILLIDEVFSVGDLDFQRKSARALHELMKQASCQLIVSHNLGFVRKECTRAIYMRDGQIRMDGEPNEVVDFYESESKANARTLPEDRAADRAA